MVAHNAMYALQQFILDALFVAEERRLGKVIDSLDRQNRELQPAANFGFRYEGEAYVPAGAPKSRSPRPNLHLSLEPQILAFQRDQARCREDRKLIGQMLFTLLHQCNDDQERRDALPDCLVQFAPAEIKKLPRRFEHEAMLTRVLNLAAHHRRQYAEILPRIQMYTAGQFIY